MIFNKEQIFLIVIIFFFGIAVMYTMIDKNKHTILPLQKTWKFQSIDTMKYSRDPVRQFKDKPSYTRDAEKQVAAIAATGATHVGIGTPYDEEFIPALKMWVGMARKYNLKVWYRGNFSGWEQWFEYKKITYDEHTQKTRQFILNHPDLFEEGDIFSSCPECENGPKLQTGNHYEVLKYREFLINNYKTAKQSFKDINKNIQCNYYSMNLDVAKAVMDPPTTAQLDGLVVIDHYVSKPEKLAGDVQMISKKSGGKVVLGEMGAPIPDINGEMTDDQQQKWIQDAFIFLSNVDELEGVNYWVNKGGSTALWRPDDSPKPAVEVITKYFGGTPKKK